MLKGKILVTYIQKRPIDPGFANEIKKKKRSFYMARTEMVKTLLKRFNERKNELTADE